MKKYLIAIAGFAGLATSPISSISSITNAQTYSPQVEPKIWTFEEEKIDQDVIYNDYIWFGIDIDLTSMGIKGINELHEYNSIIVTDLIIQYQHDSGSRILGDTWDPQKRSLGDEPWLMQRNSDIPSDHGKYWTALYTSAKLWYSDDGDFMLRLAYKAFCHHIATHGAGRVTISTGSKVEFI